MKRTRKQIGSLLLSVCMVFTMLPTAAFAEEGGQDSGTSSSTSEITAVADLAEDVALQEVESGTTADALNLPSTLTVTVTTNSVITTTVSGDDLEMDSNEQKTETQEETTLVVSEWTADPAYDGDTVGDYVYTPTLDLPDDTTLAEGVTLPQIKVTVKAADVPMLLGAGIQPLGTVNGTDITTKFTDANFLAEVRTALSKEVDAPIYDTDVASVKTLTISSKRITSLAGIEYFTALTTLNCSSNQLTELDMSKNTALEKLYCYGNHLTTLDVSNNTALTTLWCSGNQLSALDLGYNTALGYLDCQGNQLSALDVSNNTALIELYCFDNQLSALDVSNNTAFTKLDCNGNQLSALDVSKNTKLGTLNCSGNYMADKSAVKGLDTKQTTTFIFDPQKSSTSTYAVTVNSGTASPSTAAANAIVTITAGAAPSGKRFKEWTVDSGGVTLANAKLLSTTFIMPAKAVAVTATYENIPASGADITAKFTDAKFLAEVRTALGKKVDDPIYDTDFASVTSLKMSDKGIKSLAGIEYFTSLTTLDCFGNDLTALDVSKNTALTYLSCNGNLMRALDVSKNIKLTELNCSDNQLSALGVSNNTAITKLDCRGNKLSTLDVSNNIKLTELKCYGNKLSALDVSNNIKLTELKCADNQLSALDVSNNTALTTLWCQDNQLSTLDVSNNTALTTLNCSKNYMVAESAVTGINKNLTTAFIFNPQKTSPSVYAIAVNSGTASPSTAAEGATVTITANTPDSGKQFKEWTVKSGGVTLFNAKASRTTFTMPANAVEVTATYENIPAGVSVSTDTELKTALEATASQTINVTADITFTEQIKQGADHTLAIPSGKTVTASDPLGFISIGSHTLTINGGGTFVCNRNGNALFTTNGTLNLENITVNVTGGNGGILVKTINLDNSATVNLNSTSGNELIRLTDGYTLNINTGGTIEITNFNKSGIANQGGTLNINGGSLTVGKGQSDNQIGIAMSGGLLKYSSGTLNATNDAVISFTQSASAEGVSGRFIDGGYTLAAIGKINIGAADATPSVDGLTAGYYNWNSSKNAFEKQMITIEKQPQDVTVTEGIITGSLSVTASASNAETITYQWMNGNSGLISGAVDATYTLPTNLTAGTRQYKCLITAPGCMAQQTRFVTVTVNPAGGASTYAVIINHGTASLSPAAEGASVTITANTPDSGKQFKEWTVKSGGVTLFNAKASSTTFTMPANAVEITATYEAIPAGVSVSTAVELKTALEATTSQTINVTADITFKEQITQGADHTVVIPSGKMVTASGTIGFISIGNHTLTINGGGSFVCNRSGNALYSDMGILNLESITVDITGSDYGISVKTVNVNNGATVNINSPDGDQLIRLRAGYILNINMGGAIQLTNFNGSGIYNMGGTLNINGGSLTVGKGLSANQAGIWMTGGGLLKYSSGIFQTTNDAVIFFGPGTFAEGVSGRFVDGVYTLGANGKITIGKDDAVPSADGLTGGYYHWNSSKNAFERQMITIEKQPQDVTVTEGAITEILSITANASNAKTISYQWGTNDPIHNAVSPIDGAVDATYTLPTDLTAGTYQYSCIMTAPGCMEIRTRDVTVTVKPAGGASTYAITINHGTASSSTATSGAMVTITANTPDNGKRFKEWTIDSGGVTLVSITSATTTFAMPANAVEVTATYENIPAGVTPVTGVTLNKNSLSLYSNTSPNTEALTATAAPDSATDKSLTWKSSNTAVATVDASGHVTAVGNGTATITVITNDGNYTASCTVTVSTYSSGGGSSTGGGSSSGGGSSAGGSSPSGGSSSTKATTVTGNQPNQPITAAASVTATAGTNGAASAAIPDKAISDAITKAQADAKVQVKTTNGISVALNVTMPTEATALTATLSRNALNSLVSGGVTNLKINGAPVTVTFDKKALTEIQKQTSGNVNITIAPKMNLSETAKKIIGSRPVYNITVNDGNNSTVSSFGGGVATVAIPYAPANGEAIGGLYVVYVDENGNATRVDGSAYDANRGCVIFTTPHFSMYGIGYTAPSAKFIDINRHWAKESIDYVVGRGLLSGTTETTFAPDTAMTRGMLVTALGRLAGVDVSGYTTSSFTDVKAGSTFQPYIEWAYKDGIMQDIDNNQFAPDRTITREEIAVIIANFAKTTGYTLPVTREATAYSDASGIGSTYKTAVTAMQQAGIMMGGTSNKFNPKSNATRAEVSSMLHRYIKLTIDLDTAKGWAMNDAGQWYYFYTDGSLAKGVKIDNYEVDENGVRITK